MFITFVQGRVYEYFQMQDVTENEMMQQYVRAPSREDDGPRNRGPDTGFKVRNAPWSAAPDTSSTTDFPGLGAPGPAAAAASASPPIEPPRSSGPITWGPKVKR